jgi:hypothetical protein
MAKKDDARKITCASNCLTLMMNKSEKCNPLQFKKSGAQPLEKTVPLFSHEVPVNNFP